MKRKKKKRREVLIPNLCSNIFCRYSCCKGEVTVTDSRSSSSSFLIFVSHLLDTHSSHALKLNVKYAQCLYLLSPHCANVAISVSAADCLEVSSGAAHTRGTADGNCSTSSQLLLSILGWKLKTEFAYRQIKTPKPLRTAWIRLKQICVMMNGGV